jgi:hypothetical protein
MVMKIHKAIKHLLPICSTTYNILSTAKVMLHGIKHVRMIMNGMLGVIKEDCSQLILRL